MYSNLSVIKSTEIGTNVTIGEFCVVEPKVRIGNDVRIHPHVVIYDGCEIDDGVEIFPGTFIGKEPKGAGILARKIKFEKVVKIGRNTSIGPNAVVYYDVEIGDNCLIGDGAAIREKCRIASRCVIGRHVSLLDNVTVGDGTRIMHSAVMRVPARHVRYAERA